MAAVASVKLAKDFDLAFTRIAAVSNTAQGSIEGMKQQVLTLSGETAQSPVELAEALYFLASAGLDAAEVMPALEASAKASAVGLGETADVANIVASALNAYADSGLTAAKVTDVLVAAVREGRAEPDEFANALGRILPIASTVGVTFDQVAASMATLSNIGLDVNEGTTAMRGVLQALAAPGKQAADALASVGLSAQDMLDAISERGIIGALRTLDQAVKQQTNTAAEYNGVMRMIVPNVRALTGVFGLTVQEAEKVDAIFKQVLQSTGSLDDAFRTTAESDAFRMQKALNDLVIAGTKFGSAVLPMLADALSLVANNVTLLAAAFTGWILVTKVAPLLLTGITNAALNLGIAFPALSRAMVGTAQAAQTLRLAMAGLQAVLTVGITAALIAVPALVDNFSISLDKLAKDTGFTAGYLKDLDTQLSITNNWFNKVSFSGFISMLDGTRDQVQALADALAPLATELTGLGLSSYSTEQFIRSFTDSMHEATAPAIADVTDRISDNITTIKAMGRSLGQGRIDVGIFADKMRSMGFSTTEAMALADAAVDRFGFSVTKAGRRVRNFAGMSDEELQQFEEDIQESMQVGIGQFESFNDAMSLTPKEARKQLGLAVRIARAFRQDWKTLMSSDLGDTAKAAIAKLGPAAVNAFNQMRGAARRNFVKMAVDLDKLNQKKVSVDVTTKGVKQATDDARKVVDEAEKIKTKGPYEAKVAVTGADTAAADINNVQTKLDNLNGDTATTYIKVIELKGSPTPSELIASLGEGLRYLTETDWRIGVRAFGPSSLSGGSSPAMDREPELVGAGAGSQRRSLTVRLDRRRFNDELDYDSEYRGWG